MIDTRHHNIDLLFRDKLESFDPTPSPTVWKGVERGLSWHELIKFNFTNYAHNVYLMAGSAAAVVLVTVASYFVWINQDNPNKEPITPTIAQTAVSEPDNKPTTSHQFVAERTTPSTHEPTFLHARNTRPSAPIHKENNLRETVQPIGMMSLLKPRLLTMGDTAKKDFWTRTWEKIAGMDGFYKHPGKFSLGVATGYDRLTQPIDNEHKSIFNSNFNQIRFRYENYGFQVETGLALNQYEDKGLYDATYRDWDTIYSYVRVDYFIPDPTNPDSVVLITETVYVFDSLTKTATLSGTNRFTYLTIPVQVGYKIAELGRFGVTAWVGGAISFESQRKIGAPVIPSGIKTRVSYHDVTPERRSQWFMYTAGLRFDIMLNRRIQLEIEPYYKAYQNQLYVKGNLSLPHSFGINGGLSIKF